MTTALRRRAPPRRAVPPAAVAARHAAARRAHQPSRRRIRRVARAIPRGSIRAPSSRSRTIATSSTTSPAGSSSSTAATAFPGRATTPPGSSRRSSGSPSEEKQQEGLRKHARDASSNGCARIPKARQAKSKARLQRFEELASREFQERNETNEIYIPPGPRLGDLVIEAQDLRKAYGDRLLFDNLNFSLPAGRHRRHHRPERRRQDHAVPHAHRARRKPDAGEIRIGPSVQLAYVDQSRAVARRHEDRLAGDLRRPRHDQGRQLRDALARLCRPLQLPRHAAAAVIGELSGGERNRVHLAKVLKPAATCCCSTSRPTTSTSRRCARSKRRCSASRAARSSSRTIAGSSTASRPTSSRSRATARWSGSRATTRSTWRTCKRRKGEDADQPHRHPVQAAAPMKARDVAFADLRQGDCPLGHRTWPSASTRRDACTTTRRAASPSTVRTASVLAHISPVSVPDFNVLQQHKPAQVGLVYRCPPATRRCSCASRSSSTAATASSSRRISSSSSAPGEKFKFNYLPEDVEALLPGGLRLLTASLLQRLRLDVPARRAAHLRRPRRGQQAASSSTRSPTSAELAEIDEETFAVVKQVLFDARRARARQPAGDRHLSRRRCCSRC